MSQSSPNIPLAQLAQYEVAEQVEQVNAHLYDEEQRGIPDLDQQQLVYMTANIQVQMASMQQQMQAYHKGLQQVSDHQQEVDQQAEQIQATLQQPVELAQLMPASPAIQIAQTVRPAVLPVPPILPTVAMASQAFPGVDSANPPVQFKRKKSEDIEAWLLAMQLYFAANQGLSNDQMAVRLALNLGGTAQKWFHNSIDILLDQLSMQGMKQKLILAFKMPNKDQLARYQLSNLRQQGSVDIYAQVFRSTFYCCQDVSPQEARARFIEGLKPSTRLYVEEHNPPKSQRCHPPGTKL